ncbi:3'-5' exonuclease [Rheinheimera texasensis]|uniref:3'-5' exonuclease n=1 Tax=Rheinheimera texasensis TaxID=306205 RepID=UPI0032B28C6F
MSWQHWFRRLLGTAPQQAFAALQPISGQLLARQANFLVLDLETSGLDARQHHIVSAGWVCIDKLQLHLHNSFYCTVRPAEDATLGQSAVIHGLHQADLASGLTEAELLAAFIQAAAGRVLVCHHSAIESRFLQQAFLRHHPQSPALKFVDTLALELQRLQRQGSVVKTNTLSLNHCLTRHGLPQIRAHNALEDAYGCALLLLSIIRQRSNDLTLKDLLNPHIP